MARIIGYWSVAQVLFLALLVQPGMAGDYSFDLPQLAGDYLGGSPVASIDVTVDLGIDFAQIDGATLLLTGTHVPGLVGDLNSPSKLPLSAEIMARSDRPELFADVYVDQLLDAREGPFTLEAPFKVSMFSSEPPSFDPWLGGTAEFRFTVATPPMLAIYYLVESPSVTVTSATLVLAGQPNLDSFMLPGDFDRNRHVDGRDFLAWQRNPAAGDLAEWRAQYVPALSANVAVPEPTHTALAILAGLAIAARRLRAAA